MRQPIVQVDAFTAVPYAGNPAAVCLLVEPRDERWMQNVAREMNLSETAFLLPEGGGYHLRWFTPAVEVDLCGHATLASAHVLWEEGHLSHGETAQFFTRSGLLTAFRDGDWITLDFPAEPERPIADSHALVACLNVTPCYVGQNRFDFLAEMASEAEVRAAQPDLGPLKRLGGRGLIVTSRADDGEYDFVSRFFAPAAGVDEDPVTGSAHCCLAPFWSDRLGKAEMVGYQASARGGVVRVRLNGDRVLLGGQAVTVLRGELTEAASA